MKVTFEMCLYSEEPEGDYKPGLVISIEDKEVSILSKGNNIIPVKEVYDYYQPLPRGFSVGLEVLTEIAKTG